MDVESGAEGALRPGTSVKTQSLDLSSRSLEKSREDRRLLQIVESQRKRRRSPKGNEINEKNQNQTF